MSERERGLDRIDRPTNGSTSHGRGRLLPSPIPLFGARASFHAPPDSDLIKEIAAQTSYE